MRVRLRTGTTVEQAIQSLDLVATNSYGEAMPAGTYGPAERREHYVRWAARTEEFLCGVLRRADAAALFENSRHRDICILTPDDHVGILISAEVNAKAMHMREIVETLRSARTRMMSSPGIPAVIDTNIFIEHQRPDYVDWPTIVGEQPVRLVVPLRVVEEVDAMKYQGHERTRRVAREILPWLEAVLKDGTDPQNVRLNTTIEVQLQGAPRYRPMDADEEILDVYEDIRLLAGRARLITADCSMRIRARAMGFEVSVMPETYRRQRPSSAGPAG